MLEKPINTLSVFVARMSVAIVPTKGVKRFTAIINRPINCPSFPLGTKSAGKLTLTAVIKMVQQAPCTVAIAMWKEILPNLISPPNKCRNLLLGN